VSNTALVQLVDDSFRGLQSSGSSLSFQFKLQVGLNDRGAAAGYELGADSDTACKRPHWFVLAYGSRHQQLKGLKGVV
jgi:hypothetical protein